MTGFGFPVTTLQDPFRIFLCKILLFVTMMVKLLGIVMRFAHEIKKYASSTMIKNPLMFKEVVLD